MKLLILRIYLAVCITVFLTAMLLMYLPIVLPVKLFGERGRQISHHAFRLWGGSLFLTGLRLSIYGREHLVQQGPVLYIANHQSLLDTIAVFWSVKRPLRALGKASLGEIPVMGLLFQVACILVKRDHAGSRSASLAAMMRHFAAGGSLLLYPEGQMNKNPPALQPFSDAGIRVAMRYGLALQPIAVAGAGRLLPATGRFLIHPGTLRVEVAKAWLPEDYAGRDAAEVTEEIRQWMSERVG